MDTGKRVCFAALIVPAPVDVELHITVGVAKDVTEHEARMMQVEMERKIRPHLPIQVEICNYRLRGNDNTIATYDVAFPDRIVDELLKKFYRAFYKGDPAKRQYPLLEAHVTVDTPAKLSYIESLIHGPQKGCFQVLDTTFQVRQEGGDPIYSSDDWKCASCGKTNPIERKECLTIGCSQWRPQQAMPRRPGDWECCGSIVFGSKPNCLKCGRPNPNLMATNFDAAPSAPFAPFSQSLYEAPPPAPAHPHVAAALMQHSAPDRRGYHPDWRCCGDLVFGSKTHCRKCGRRRPG
jgi:hypothetical protein